MAKIDAFFKLMNEQGASDLHLTTGQQPALRIRGEIERIKYKVLDSDELRVSLEGGLSYTDEALISEDDRARFYREARAAAAQAKASAMPAATGAPARLRSIASTTRKLTRICGWP